MNRPQGLKRALFSVNSFRCLIAAIVVPALALALAAPAAPAAGAIEVVDDHGRAVRLQGPARRIVSLAPHITENLFSAGAGQFVVGAVDHSDYPAAARAVRRVGGYHNFDAELILALQPDLVIAWKEGNPLHLVEKLERLGLTVYITEPKRLEDIPRNIVRFGVLTGAEDSGPGNSATVRRGAVPVAGAACAGGKNLRLLSGVAQALGDGDGPATDRQRDRLVRRREHLRGPEGADAANKPGGRVDPEPGRDHHQRHGRGPAGLVRPLEALALSDGRRPRQPVFHQPGAHSAAHPPRAFRGPAGVRGSANGAQAI